MAVRATMAGYALGQLRLRGSTVVLVLILVLVGSFVPFAVYWMRAHFITMPGELMEASAIDGANRWQAFTRIQVPLAVPAITSMCLLLFLWTWNAFLQAIVLIDDPSKRTMAGALQNFVGQYTTDVVLLNAGSLLIMAPTILVFLVFQRHFVKALIAGAVKG